ncbi:MAG: LolA family protein [Bdellovibrionia bacterium]
MIIPQMTLKLTTFLSCFLIGVSSASAQKSTLLESTIKKYKRSSLVTMMVDKKVTSELIGKEVVYSGEISLAGKLFRWDTNTPEESILLFDGKTIWSVQKPPKDLPGPIQVSKSQNIKQIQKQSLLSILLGEEKVNENFKILNEIEANGTKVISLEPLKKDLSVKNLVVKIDVKKQELTQVSYIDDLSNQTELVFKKTKFSSKKPNSKLFKYNPPKGAQVTEI